MAASSGAADELSDLKVDAERRIAERRARVAKRQEKESGAAGSGGTGGGTDGAAVDAEALAAAAELAATGGSVAIRKVQDAMRNLDATKERTIDEVTQVRVTADAREHERRATEAVRVSERQERLKEEAGAAARANASVTMRWADLRERALPLELSAELEQQKAACARILESRDSLLAALGAELKLKDEEYVRGLQQQRTDVDALLSRMASQFEELREMYGDELAAVEGAFLRERDEMLVSNKAEVDALFEARRRTEARYADDKLAREERYAAEAYSLQAADLENFQKLKVKLETDVSILEQQLEHMKFIYLLNTEKLEYNYRVLTERDNENKAALAAQKARLARLRASLAKVQADYDGSDHKFRLRNEALTKEYQRATRSYRELQGKFRHFEAADALRYAAVCSVHEAEVAALATRLTTADKVITEQLLGLAWTPASAGAGLSATASVYDSGSVLDSEGHGHRRHHHHHHHHLLLDEASAGAVDEEPAVDARKLQPLLRLLVAECGPFIGDTATREACVRLDAEGKREQAQVLRADALLRALGCESAAAVVGLTQHFEYAIAEAGGRGAAAVAAATAAASAGGSKESDDDEGLADTPAFSLALTRPDGTPVLPPSFSVLRTLRSWVEARKLAAGAEAEGGIGGGSVSGLDDTLQRIAEAQSHGGDGTVGSVLTGVGGGGAARRDKNDLARWQRMADAALPPARVRIWQALERGMQKYQKVLLKRLTLITECESLTASNAELRQLLAFYLAQPQASELHVGVRDTMVLGPNTRDVDQIASDAAAVAAAAGTARGTSGRAAAAQSKSGAAR